jgi:hypothetical protein
MLTLDTAGLSTNVKCHMAVVRCLMDLAKKPNRQLTDGKPFGTFRAHSLALTQRRPRKMTLKNDSSPLPQRSSAYPPHCPERRKAAIFAVKFCDPGPRPQPIMAKREERRAGLTSFTSSKSFSRN